MQMDELLEANCRQDELELEELQLQTPPRPIGTPGTARTADSLGTTFLFPGGLRSPGHYPSNVEEETAKG